jgi:hypothetical protein
VSHGQFSGVAATQLTPEQIQQVATALNTVQSDGVAKTVTNTSAAIRTEASEWAEIGSNIGSAMVSAAKELGVAANEFSQTGIGKITTVIIAYKIIGNDILGVIIGTGILIGFVGAGFRIIFGPCLGDIVYETRTILWGLCNVRVIKEISFTEDTRFGKAFTGIILIVIGSVVGLNVIF